MRELIERYLVWFKADLQIATACATSRDTLVSFLAQGTYFSDELRAYFTDGKTPILFPYTISPSDPSQVAVLKKIINALHNTEKVFKDVESIDLKADRNSLSLYKDVVKVIYDATNQLYAALQLVNGSSADVQMIIGPHLNAIISKMGVLSDSLEQLSSKTTEEGEPDGLASAFRADPTKVVADIVAAAVENLPKEKQTYTQGMDNLSHLIFALPKYFESLQRLVATGSCKAGDKSKITVLGYEELMLENAQKTKQHFDSILKKNSLFAIPAYLQILSLLGGHSVELLGAAAPLTKEAYVKAVAKLNEIRHDYLPQLVSELERIEENLALKPGVLVGPALKQMTGYYEQIAKSVNGIANAAGVLDGYIEEVGSGYKKIALELLGGKIPELTETVEPTPNLEIMVDDKFSDKLRASRSMRLVEAVLASKDDRPLQAAQRFFDKLKSYTAFSQLKHQYRLATIVPEEKKALLNDYKQFQMQFAAMNPELDEMIVRSLDPDSKSAYWSMSSLYKNEFTEVTNCQKSVMPEIEQYLAQHAFRARLIESGSQKREQALYLSQKETTQLAIEVAPFKEIKFEFVEGLSADEYLAKERAMTAQSYRLQAAKQSLSEFDAYLRNVFPNTNPTVGSLTPVDKEALRKMYQKFRPHVVALIDFETFDKQFVFGLEPFETCCTLKISDVFEMRRQVAASVDKLISETQTYTKGFADKERDVRQTEVEASKAVPLGKEFEKRTLFGQVKELRLAKTVNTFLYGRLKTFLEDSLDPDVAGRISFGNLPYDNIHKETSDVAVYKRLVNSIYYLQNVLEKMEAAGGTKENTGLFHRWWYGLRMLQLLRNIADLKYHLERAAENPGLVAIVKDGLDILSPLQAIPVIGDYINGAVATSPQMSAQGPKINIVEAWKAQLEIVKRAREGKAFVDGGILSLKLGGGSTAPKVAPVDEPADVSLQKIIGQLYRLPQQLQKLQANGEEPVMNDPEIDAKVAALVTSLEGLTFGPGSLKVLLDIVGNLNASVTDLGANARSLIMRRIGELPVLVGAKLVAIADSSEFQLGFKPGLLSQKVIERFDGFYNELIDKLPFKKDQEILMLRISPALLKTRLSAELHRHQVALLEQEIHEVEYAIFGGPHPDVEIVDDLYTQLDVLVQGGNLMGSIEPLNEVYLQLRPYLLDHHDEASFGVDFITSVTDEETLRARVNELQELEDMISRHEGAFETLERFNLLEDEEWSNPANQIKFLQTYQELQPYLERFDRSYDLNYFLRKLETPANFEIELRKILGYKNKLLEIVEADANSRYSKVDQSDRRINYLEEQLMSHERAAVQEVNKFKEKVFLDYLDAEVQSQFDEELGKYAEAFFAKILPDFVLREPEVLQDITCEDDIVKLIAQRVDSELQPAILENFKALKLAYQALNESLKKVKAIERPANNQFRREMLRQLDNEAQRLLREEVLAPTTNLEQLHEENVRAQAFLNQFQAYFNIEPIYNVLVKMENRIRSHPDQNFKINHKKLSEIKALKKLLTDDSKPLNERLMNLKMRVGSPECQKVLLKNSDNVFLALLKSFWSYLTGWKSAEQKLVTDFNDKVSKIPGKSTFFAKIPDPKPAVALEEDLAFIPSGSIPAPA